MNGAEAKAAREERGRREVAHHSTARLRRDDGEICELRWWTTRGRDGGEHEHGWIHVEGARRGEVVAYATIRCEPYAPRENVATIIAPLVAAWVGRKLRVVGGGRLEVERG